MVMASSGDAPTLEGWSSLVRTLRCAIWRGGVASICMTRLMPHQQAFWMVAPRKPARPHFGRVTIYSAEWTPPSYPSCPRGSPP